MSSSTKRNAMRNEWEMSTIERKYSVPPGAAPLAPNPGTPPLQAARGERGSTSEDLHAWSIYSKAGDLVGSTAVGLTDHAIHPTVLQCRCQNTCQLHLDHSSKCGFSFRQNLNSDFTDSALGSSEKSPLPYGNFQLRESTVHSIINHPRYGPKSALSSNMYTYLKFGLPRVFPPSGRGRDGSSGYNSSDDGSPGPLKTRGPARARSELDFRNLNSHSNYHKAQPQRNGRISNSEANLLSMGTYHQEPPRSRRSVAGPEVRGYRPDMREARAAEHRKSFHDLRSAAVHDPTFHRLASERRRTSKAGSHLSLNQSKIALADMRRAHSVVGHTNPVAVPYYPAPHPHAVEAGTYPYPHLQVRNMEISALGHKDRLVVQGVSFEVRGGEMLAIMATNAQEGSTLLAALSGDRLSNYGKVSGEMVLNGNLIERSQLRKRCAFVRSEGCWDLDLTVKQTLYLQHRLRHVKRKIVKLPLDDRIASLVGDLGLDQVSGTKLSGLTQSELRRLSVAIHLLMDVQILMLDQPTKGMDIFDTFFLIEYLRQWALNGDITDMSGRAVILTLQPPTYEILTMISRVLIISNSHVMYSGTTSLLLPYFTSAEYPCPPYKNPSDYYLDLVTLDDLSAEAMLESSQRMSQLGELHRRRQTPLSDPGPPATLPPVLRYSNPFQQAATLFLRNGIWSQPSSFIRYLFHILLAAILSFLVGAIFWDVPGSDPQLLLEDRLGFHHTVLCVTLWPLLLLSGVSSVRRERSYVLAEVRQGLYSPAVYVIMKVLSSLPGSLLMWLSYLVPSFIMSGLHFHGSNSESTASFYQYTGLCLLYLHALQLLTQAFTWLGRRIHYSLFLAAIVFTFFFALSGHAIHTKDAPGPVGRGLHMGSPTWWLTSTLLQRELDKDAFRNQNHVCRNKQKDIIVQVACPKPNGTAELEYLGMAPARMGWMPTHAQETTVVLGLLWLASFILLLICFAIAASRRTQTTKPQRSTNKP